MRSGVEVRLNPGDRERLEAVVGDRNSPQKHVWRAEIVLLTADGLGTNAIMRRTGKSKPCVWRWQERFMTGGVDGLLHDKTRPPGKAPIPETTVAELIEKTLHETPPEATHWTVRDMAKAMGIAASTVQKIWRAHGLAPHRLATSSSPTTLPLSTSCRTSSGCTSTRRPMQSFCRWMKSRRSKRSIAPSPACP